MKFVERQLGVDGVSDFNACRSWGSADSTPAHLSGEYQSRPDPRSWAGFSLTAKSRHTNRGILVAMLEPAGISAPDQGLPTPAKRSYSA